MNNNGSRNDGKVVRAIMAAGLLAVFLCGCISVPIGTIKEKLGRPEVTTRLLGTEGLPEFYPEVQRKGGKVQLRMMTFGTFVEETTTTQTYKVQNRKLAMGVAPGVVDDYSSSFVDFVLVYPVFLAWYTAATIGIATVSGVLVEPFLSPRQSGNLGGNEFRRGALVGFSKYMTEDIVVEKSKPIRRMVPKTQSVERIALWFDAEPKFWESSMKEGDTLVLRGVVPGRHEGKLYIKSVPPGHEYEKELKKMKWVPINVEIPE